MIRKEWPYVTSKQLQKSLNECHRALFDMQILRNDCESSQVSKADKKYLPEIKRNIFNYKKIIQQYEDGIVTVKNRGGFAI